MTKKVVGQVNRAISASVNHVDNIVVCVKGEVGFYRMGDENLFFLGVRVAYDVVIELTL
jgi:hypothetical protein